jgi:hypothetical protein
MQPQPLGTARHQVSAKRGPYTTDPKTLTLPMVETALPSLATTLSRHSTTYSMPGVVKAFPYGVDKLGSRAIMFSNE